ncbi:hypothetical protein TYRP_001273 [Tyrophagus putrescentiae]|nr:hypothetical protein TYRP_001273 [Tyrophagus putrescentiae]
MSFESGTLLLSGACNQMFACQVFENHKPYPLFSVGVNASHVTVINRELVVFEVHLNQLNLDTHQLHIAEHYRPKSLFSKWPALNQSDVSESISNGRDVFTATFGSKLFLNVIDFGSSEWQQQVDQFRL